MEDREINIVDYWNIIWKKRKLIIACVIIISIVAAIISLLLPKWYMANAVILPPEQEENTFGGVGATLKAFGFGDMVGSNENIYKLIAILKSRALLYKMNNRFDFQEKYNCEFLDETIQILKQKINIKVEEEGQIVFSIEDKDQDSVADMANYAIEVLDSLNISLTSSYARNSREFIESRINVVTDSLFFYENELSSFMDLNNVISIEDQLAASVEKAASMKLEIVGKEIERELLNNNLIQDSPRLKEINFEIEVLNSKYNDFFTRNLEDPNRIFIEFNEISQIQMDFLQLKRKIQYFSQLLEFLAPQYEQAKINEVKDIPTVQVLDKAVRPEKRVRPKRTLIVFLTIFASSIFIIGVVLVSEGIKRNNNHSN